jgi:isocitrate dehydrogenase
MSGGDFYSSENSTTVPKATEVRYEFVDAKGTVTVLKKKMGLLAGEILDTSVMHVKPLRKFFEEQIEDAKQKGLLLSLHLKATMMKISDPVMFGLCDLLNQPPVDRQKTFPERIFKVFEPLFNIS